MRLRFGEEKQGSERRNARKGVPNGADFATTREVVRMWKRQLLKAICFLAGIAILMYLSAINAC